MRSIKHFLFTSILIGLFLNNYAQVAGDFRSAGTGNWSAPGTWQRYSSGGAWQNSGAGENNPGQVPGVGTASGNVTIQNAHTITFDITNATAIASLTVGGGASGILQFESVTNRTLTVTGNVSVSTGASFIAQAAGAQAGSLVVGGTFSNVGVINFRQSAARYIDLTLNGTSLTGNGTYTALRNITIGGTVTNNSTSTINIYGNLTTNNTFTCSAGMLSFLSGGAQSITGTTNPTFNNLDIRTTSTVVTVGGTLSNITVNGALTMNGAGTPTFSLGTTLTTFSVAGAFTMANAGSNFDFGTTVAKAVSITGNLVTPQTITMSGAGLAHQLILTGATNAAPGVFTTAPGSGSIVEYNGTAQSIFASANYRILKLSGSNTKTFSGATTVNNDLNITGSSITVSNVNTLGISGNLNNTGTGTTTWGGTPNTTSVTGDLWITNNTTFTIGNQAAVKTINVSGKLEVDAGSTMNVAAFAAVQVLNLSGNMEIDGTFNMVQTFPANVCNVTFSGASNTTITSPGGSGTINFNQITLSKTALANTLDVLAPITMSSPTASGIFLNLNTGTFKLSSASTLTPYYGSVTICAATAGLWINHASASISCVQTNTSAAPGNPTITGFLRVTAGNFSYGSGNDVMTLNASTSNLFIEGGTVTMYGAVAFTSTSQFNMTSGNFKVDPQGFDNLAAATTVVSFGSTNASNAVTFTGGTLTIMNPPVVGAGGTSLYVTPTAGYAYNFSGSTINLGDGVSNKNGIVAVGFTIDAGGRYPLYNLIMNNGASVGTYRFARLATTDCIINGDLSIGNNVNDNFQLNGRLLTLNNTLTMGTGTLTGSATSSLTIGGNGTPVMNLPAIGGGNLLNLTINKTGANNLVNLGGHLTLAATGVLTLTSGVLEIGNYNLQLLNSAAAGLVGVGGAQTYSASNMIATDGTGALIGNAVNPSQRVNNPVGAMIGGTYYYSPMTLTSITAGGTYNVRVVPTPLNPSYLKIYWDFVTSAGAKTITATFQYDPAELNGASQVIVYSPYPYTTTQSPPSSGTSTFGSNSFTITNNVTATTGSYWSMGNSSNYYSYQTGDWNAPSTWTSDPSGTLQVGSTVPGYNDNVYILPGRTVSLTSNITTRNMNLTINNSGYVDMGTYSFSNGLAALSGQGTLRLASVNFPIVASNTFVNSGGGTTEYNNMSSFTLPAVQTIYNHLTINCAGQTATQTVNLTLNGNLLISSGTFQINDNTAARRQLTISGNVTVNSGAAISVGKGVTNSTTVPTSITTTVAGPYIDYYDSQSHRVVVYGDFINNGTVNFSNIAYPVYNAFPPTTLGTTTGFATVYFRGSTSNVLTCNNVTNFYNLVLDKGSDQTYSLSINSSAYTNFKLFGANVAAADGSMGATATNPNVKKALWIRNGTLTLQGSTVIPSLTEGNTTGTLPATSDYFIPANGALNITGPDVIVLVTADDYQEVNTSYGVSGGTGTANGVIKGGYSSMYVYGTYQMSEGYLSTRESGGIVTNGGSGQIIMSGGNLDAKQFLNGTGSTASFQMSGGFFTLRGRFQRIPSSYASITDLIDTTTATIGTARALNGTTTGFGTFSLNNASNIFNMSAGDIWIYDVCDAAPPATAQFAFDVKSSSPNINVTGGTVTFIPMNGTVLANESNFLVSSTAALGNVMINRASSSTVVQLNTSFPLTVLRNMTITAGDFNANGQNLTIGGDFTIANASTVYTSGSNTTTLNGSGTQTFTVNLSSALNLNNLAFNKTAGVAVNFAGTQKNINVAGTFNLTLGTLNDNGNSIFVAGHVYNSGLHSGTGKISLNGTTTQTIDGNGIFHNLELNNTNAAAAPVSLISNTTINGALTFSQNKLFNISTYNLKLNAAASIVNAGTARYIQSAGNAGDGGITKVYNATTAFVFPMGSVSTSHASTPYYTPASIGFGTAPTTYGSITVVPVGYAHPNATTAGRSLSYFWRVSSSGFTMGSATVTHGYTYSANDVITGTGITEAGYVAARYNLSTATWTRGTTSDLDITGKIIGQPTPGTFLKNVNFIDGDYTAGDDNPTNPFGTPKTFYSYATGAWGSAANWTSDPTRASYVNIGTPGASDIVYIGNNHTISFGMPTGYLTTANTDPHYCATLYIDAGATLDVRYNPSSNLGIVMNSSAGNGKIRITCAQASNSTFANPLGDFSSFNSNLGTTELYTTNPASGTTYWMANGVSTYGNLLFSPSGGSNILFPNNDVLIYGSCTETGGNADSWLLPCWNATYPTAPTTTVAKTITINGNLDIQGGSFGWYQNGTTAQNVVVKGNVKVCATCAFDGTWGNATNQTLTIGGSLINDANGGTNGSSTTCRVNLSNVPTTFNGSINATISNTTGSPVTIFGTLTVNKGSSQATTLNCTIGGTLTTPADNWFTILNGTFQYQRTNPATNFTISQATNITIPSTAGLYFNYPNSANTSVLIANNGSDASDLFLSGKLTLVSGNVYIGPTAATSFNNDIEYSGTSAAIEVNGGNLYVNGQIRRPTATTNGSLTYSQTSGTVTINGNSSPGGLITAQTRAKLAVVNQGSQFNMSGGTLSILRGGGTTFGDLYIRPSSSSVTGGTIIFTNTIPNAIQNYTMDSNVPLNNLTITQGGSNGTNATLTLMTNPLTLNGSLTFSNNKSFFSSNNNNVTINQDLINNGAPGCYIYGTNMTTFSGSTQNISGSAVTNFYDLTVSPTISLTVNNSFSVNRNLNITSGNLFLNAYKVSVLNAGNFTNNGAYTDNNAVSSGVSMAGSAQQEISGTGSYQRLEINNSSGVSLANDITLLHDLAMTAGIFDIKSYNLILNTSSSINGSSFSSSKMIKTDGVASSGGLTKFFPIINSTTGFTFPMGVTGKYTPAVYSINANGSIGYINVNPVNSYQPTVIDPTKVLDYYWSIASSGITGFNGSLTLNYLVGDVQGTESNYIAAWLQLPGTYWSKAAVGAGTDNVNETTHQVSFTYPAGSSNLNGDYTAGEDPAIPNQIPTYISNSNGSWSDNTIWTPVGSSPPCPVGGPNGYIVIIKDSVATTANHCFAYSTTIRSTGKLAVISPTYGHNFGTVDGDSTLGTGTLYLQNGNMPAGNYTLFLDCTGNGTLEYGGTGTYTIILNGVTTLPNLTVSGTGTRILPNTDLVICNRLKINGPTLDNSVSNKKLTINGSMERYSTGAFLSGSGSGATVTFSGSSAQSLGGPLGDFTGGNAFNNMEINNSSGLTIGANGAVEVNGNLLLTTGVITTSGTSTLSLLNTSSSAVVPTGGSSSSYIRGPLKKQIVNGGSFIYPLGKTTVGHTFTLTSSSGGTNTFTAEYFTPNATYTSVTSPLVIMNSREYWGVTATGSKNAKVKMAWDAQSDLNGTMTQNGISDLQAAEYNSGTSAWVGLTSTTSGSNSTGDVITNNNVNLNTTQKNYSIGSITNTKPTATLSPTGPVCGTSGIPVTFTSFSPITLNYTLTYKLNGVTQTPIVITSLPYTLPTPTAGTYQLISFLYNNSTMAGAVDGTIITNYASPTVSNAGSNQAPCNATSLNLPGNTPSVGTGLWTVVSGTSGWFNTPDATNSNALFGGPPGHSYVLKWTITNGTCTSSSTVNISFPFSPAQPSAFTSAPTSVCQGSTNNAYTVPAVSGASSYSWSYSGTGATITGNTNSVSISFSASATSGTLSVAAVNGCGTGTARTTPITVTATSVATFSYTGTPYCQNASNPSPTFSGGGSAGTFSSTPGLVFVSTTTGQVDLAASTPGTYTVTNTKTASGPCATVTATSSITITGLGTWTGGTSNDWFNPNNWICTTIPTSSIDVTIPASATIMPIINGTGAVCRSLTISSGASLTISGTNNLDVYGSWTNQNTFTANSSTVTFNGTATIAGAATNTFNNIIVTGTGNLTAPSGNMNVTGNWTNNGTFANASGTVTLTGSGTQTIGGSVSSTFNNLTVNNNDATGVNISKAATVNTTLTLSKGKVNTTSAQPLTLANNATTTIGNSASYINGPLAYVMAKNGTSTLNLPLGKGSEYRPVVVTPTHSTATSYTYTAELFNASAKALGWTVPNTLTSVSSAHYTDVNRTVTATGLASSSTDLTSATIQMYYSSTNGTNDVVTDYTHLAIAKAPTGGSAWTDIGGTATANGSGSITSGTFNSFSRFALANEVSGINPLPIELISFTATPVYRVVVLEWATASEKNNDYFTIERSKDGMLFEAVEKIKGAGNSNSLLKYGTTDSKPFEGTSYYRLKQTDFDGKYTYSKLVKVEITDENEFSIYPNPGDGQNINMLISSKKDSELFLSISSSDGSLTYSKTIVAEKDGINQISLHPEINLEPGIFFITITSGQTSYVKKYIVKY